MTSISRRGLLLGAPALLLASRLDMGVPLRRPRWMRDLHWVTHGARGLVLSRTYVEESQPFIIDNGAHLASLVRNGETVSRIVNPAGMRAQVVNYGDRALGIVEDRGSVWPLTGPTSKPYSSLTFEMRP